MQIVSRLHEPASSEWFWFINYTHSGKNETGHCTYFINPSVILDTLDFAHKNISIHIVSEGCSSSIQKSYILNIIAQPLT